MWSTVAKSPFLVKFFIILKYVYHLLFIIICTYWFLKMHPLWKWMWSLQKKKGSRWLIKNLNNFDRSQWESNPDLCKGCTVPSLGILWTHNNWPDFQVALQLISVLCIHPYFQTWFDGHDLTERLPSSTVFYLEYPTGIKAHNLKVTLMIAWMFLL